MMSFNEVTRSHSQLRSNKDWVNPKLTPLFELDRVQIIK